MNTLTQTKVTSNNNTTGSHLYNSVKSELIDHILPFWLDKIDLEHGGFYGFMSHALIVDKKSMKGGLAATRLLWTFSRAAFMFDEPNYKKAADHIYLFLKSHLIDPLYHGIYYGVDYKGNPLDTRKHIYIQAFGIYGLSEYYNLSHSEEALNECIRLYNLIITRGYDLESDAYLEEFDQTWNPLNNELLSENGVLADYTYNTHLHIIEAFTNLYKFWPDESLKERIEGLLNVFYSKIYNQKTHFFNVFFDKQWTSIIDLKSYGHDIETSWLIDEAIKTLGNIEPSSNWNKMVIDPAYAVLNEALDSNGGMNYELENGKLNRKKVWWVQSEAFIGFFNAYERTKDSAFLDATTSIWEFIQTYFVDTRQGGEWFSERDSNNEITHLPIIEPWKLSYHNGRCCLEFISRHKA